jgi:hypothetical protein
MMYWVCTCGEKFKENGDRGGYGKYIKHMWRSINGEIEGEHKCTGLFDENDEILVEGQNIKGAIKNGYIKPADKKKKKEDKKNDKDMQMVNDSVRVKANVYDIKIDPELFFLYYSTRTLLKEYDLTVGEWISDIITAFYCEHPEIGLQQILMHNPKVQNFLQEQNKMVEEGVLK